MRTCFLIYISCFVSNSLPYIMTDYLTIKNMLIILITRKMQPPDRGCHYLVPAEGRYWACLGQVKADRNEALQANEAWWPNEAWRPYEAWKPSDSLMAQLQPGGQTIVGCPV